MFVMLYRMLFKVVSITFDHPNETELNDDLDEFLKSRQRHSALLFRETIFLFCCF